MSSFLNFRSIPNLETSSYHENAFAKSGYTQKGFLEGPCRPNSRIFALAPGIGGP